MSDIIKFAKVTALPGTLEPNTVYFIQDGDKLSVSVSNIAGSAVMPLSAGTDVLGGTTKILPTYIPDAILGQLEYQGSRDMSVALPAASTANKGYYYITSVAGNGYDVGDWAVSNGTSWDKIDNTDTVKTVGSISPGSDGNVALTGAALGTNPTFTGYTSDTSGKLRSLPKSAETGNIVAADAGKFRAVTAGITINTTSAFGIGDTMVVYNDSASNITITFTSVTAYLSGTAAAKTTLALTPKGLCSVLCVAANTYVISGDVS